ncbi:unnamed protein product [Sphagnum tenellum]
MYWLKEKQKSVAQEKKKLANRCGQERSVTGGQKKAGGQGATFEDMAGGRQNNKTSKRRQNHNSPVFGDS